MFDLWLLARVRQATIHCQFQATLRILDKVFPKSSGLAGRLSPRAHAGSGFLLGLSVV